jgi:hypothetical protein
MCECVVRDNYIMTDKKPHYVNNANFSSAVVEYVKSVNEAKEKDEVLPKVPNYIAECFLKIAEGLAHKSNFIRYTYREEMVMDAVENCLKAVENYNIEAATRTGNPNAFAYFTQITWYAFLRRIAKEKKQQDIKLKYMMQSPITEFMDGDIDDNVSIVIQSYVDQLKTRIDQVKERDAAIKEFAKEEKKAKRIKLADSNLEEFFE